MVILVRRWSWEEYFTLYVIETVKQPHPKSLRIVGSGELVPHFL
jgi:hypothetical protein